MRPFYKAMPDPNRRPTCSNVAKPLSGSRRGTNNLLLIANQLLFVSPTAIQYMKMTAFRKIPPAFVRLLVQAAQPVTYPLLAGYAWD